MKLAATVLCIAAALAAVWWWLREAPAPSRDGAGVSAQAVSEVEAAAALSAGPQAARVEASAPAPVHAAPVELAALPEEEILALLRDIALHASRSESAELQKKLEALLSRPANMDRVVDWMSTPDQGESPATDELALRGALLALEASLSLYNESGGPFAAAGEPLTRRVLRALPTMSDAVRAAAIEALLRARSSTGPVVDARYLSELLELRRTSPAIASELSALFGPIASSLGTEEARAEFRRLLLGETNDPTAIKVALSALLAEAPAAFLTFAEELAKREDATPELRAAIVQAIATSAPVGDAVPLLARLASDADYLAFMTLATRPGAADALAREYDALLVSEANARGRKLVVSGMEAERPEVLLGIARTDPDPGVRAQALMTLTLGREVGAEVIDELVALRDAKVRDTPGISTQRSILVAHNVLLKSSGAARERARDYLVSIVRDGRASESDRLAAFAKLKGWVAPGTFTGIVLGGHVIE